MAQAEVVVSAPAALVVSAGQLRKAYGKTIALAGVDLEVVRGTMHGLIGPDGAGKSTLMKIIAGVLQYDSGTVSVFGNDITSERTAEPVKSRMGLMPQGLGQNLYPDLSIEENVDFLARLRGVDEATLASRKTHLLDLTRLSAFRDRPVKNLSGGMKQKLGLVCTLIHQPELIILDEPTTGVDPVSRRDFWAILDQLVVEQQLTILVSTAYMDEASHFAVAALMWNGKVLASGVPAALAASLGSTVVSIRVDDPATVMVKIEAGLGKLRRRGAWLRVVVPQADAAKAGDAVRAALPTTQIRELVTSEPDLEDLFIAKAGMAGTALNLPPAKTAKQSGKIAIKADNLVRMFGEFRAVDNVSFVVKAGEIFGLLGANGAGKTTVIKMLTGMIPPTQGSGQVAGADMTKASALIKQRIGYMSQAFSLYLELTVAENLRLFAAIYCVPRATRAARIADVVALCDIGGIDGTIAGALPMGQRQRLALACALIHQPEVLFLDEPTSGVDPIGRMRFWDILYALARRDDVALLVTTHYMTEAEQCDHICLMYAGRVVADATPDVLKADLARSDGLPFEFAVDHRPQAVAALQSAGFASAGLAGTGVRLIDKDAATLPKRLALALKPAGLAATALKQRPITMEDVFVQTVTRLEAAAQPQEGDTVPARPGP